jgi:hypothetical protein
LHAPLLTITDKLLGRQNLNFEQLTTPEQKLWQLFEKSDIYEFVTSEKDTIPEFRHDYVGFAPQPCINFNTQAFFQNLQPGNPNQVASPPTIQRAHSAQLPATSHNLCE